MHCRVYPCHRSLSHLPQIWSTAGGVSAAKWSVAPPIRPECPATSPSGSPTHRAAALNSPTICPDVNACPSGPTNSGSSLRSSRPATARLAASIRCSAAYAPTSASTAAESGTGTLCRRPGGFFAGRSISTMCVSGVDSMRTSPTVGCAAGSKSNALAGPSSQHLAMPSRAVHNTASCVVATTPCAGPSRCRSVLWWCARHPMRRRLIQENILRRARIIRGKRVSWSRSVSFQPSSASIETRVSDK
mmetsp:Transcript_11561/g.26530  ORF Transcript_11561/g.26530 Transcript_11561/m.26530 type:complete len:246 (-) Transcript_11561:351-1088(-)